MSSFLPSYHHRIAVVVVVFNIVCRLSEIVLGKVGKRIHAEIVTPLLDMIRTDVHYLLAYSVG